MRPTLAIVAGYALWTIIWLSGSSLLRVLSDSVGIRTQPLATLDLARCRKLRPLGLDNFVAQ